MEKSTTPFIARVLHCARKTKSSSIATTLRRMRGFSFSMTLIAAALTPFISHAADTITQKTLSNGMLVIVLEEHRAPVAMQLLCYRVGSVDEPVSLTGMSHVLEHMMFKGTRKAPGNTFSEAVRTVGGIENAYTTYDYTAYHQVFSKDHLERMMRFESDRMRNLKFSDNDFDKEVNVVREERLRSEDDPFDMLVEQLSATAFQTHPYRNPIIGWMPDLYRLKKENVLSWYNQWYAPNNAVLIVAGDVDPKRVFSLAEKYYGTYKPVQLPNRFSLTTNPTADGMRRITLKHPQTKLPSIAISFPVPSLKNINNDNDVYALSVLADILSNDSSSRLSKSLVRETKSARSAWASYSLFHRGPTLFWIGGSPSDGVSPEVLESQLRDEIKKIADNGVSETELNRVKSNLIAAQQYQRDSLSSRANLIARLVMTGLPADGVDTIIAKLKAVTAAQVQAVAKKYFNADYSTVAVLQPADANAAPNPTKDNTQPAANMSAAQPNPHITTRH